MFSYNLKSDIFKTDIFETAEKHFIDKSKETNFIKITMTMSQNIVRIVFVKN